MLSSMIIAAANRRKLNRKAPNGQAFFQASGSYKWTCPNDVTKVSVALVGSGGSGYWENRQVGAGANVRWINDIDVVPGQVYSITIPAQRQARNLQADNTTSAFGFTAASPLSTLVKGANGSPSIQTLNNEYRAGGCVGYIGSGTTGQGIDLKTFTAVAPGESSRFNGGYAGGGGGYGSSASGLGGVGAVRIIWGKDRAFPNQNIHDMVDFIASEYRYAGTVTVGHLSSGGQEFGFFKPSNIGSLAPTTIDSREISRISWKDKQHYAVNARELVLTINGNIRPNITKVAIVKDGIVRGMFTTVSREGAYGGPDYSLIYLTGENALPLSGTVELYLA